MTEEWYDSRKKPSGDFRQLLQVRLEKANCPRRLTSEEKRQFEKLEAIAAEVTRGDNVKWVSGWRDCNAYNPYQC